MNFYNPIPPALSMKSPDDLLGLSFDPDDQYFLNGVISRGQPTSIIGQGGAGKSRFVNQLAVALITGKPFLGFEVKPRALRWLYIQTENSNARLQADFKSLQAWVGNEAWKKVNELYRVHTVEPDDEAFLALSDTDAKKSVGQAIKDFQPDVVVFDPLYAFAAGSLNTDAGMLATCRAIIELARLGKKDCAILIVHHALAGKPGLKKVSGIDKAAFGKGSKALQQWTRGQINIAPAGDSTTRLTVVCGKNSNGPEFETFGIRLNPSTMLYERNETAEFSEVSTASPRISLQNIAQLLRPIPLKKSALVKAIMEEYGCSKSTAYSLVAQAEGRTIFRNQRRLFEPIGNLENPEGSTRIIRIPA
jgi:hypothetical protein